MPESSAPAPGARLLSRDVLSRPLEHEPAPGVLAGSPVSASCTLSSLGPVEVGVWELTPGTVRDTEVDEVFVVLAGAGRVEFEDGEVVELAPGVAVGLTAGERTTWTVTETLRKIWVA